MRDGVSHKVIFHYTLFPLPNEHKETNAYAEVKGRHSD